MLNMLIWLAVVLVRPLHPVSSRTSASAAHNALLFFMGILPPRFLPLLYGTAPRIRNQKSRALHGCTHEDKRFAPGKRALPKRKKTGETGSFAFCRF